MILIEGCHEWHGIKQNFDSETPLGKGFRPEVCELELKHYDASTDLFTSN
jgi:hypothetical protein